MISFLRHTDSIAVVGSGLALSVYKWLMREGFNCEGCHASDRLQPDGLSQISLMDGTLEKEMSGRTQGAEIQDLPRNIDIVLIDIPLSHVARDTFETLINRYRRYNKKLKLIFFPRIDLPGRVETNDVIHLISRVNNSIKTIERTFVIAGRDENIAFFPLHQLVFYLGLRSQVENGKNRSLELVQLAIDLFRHLYMPNEPAVPASESFQSASGIEGGCDFFGDSHILNILEAIHMPGSYRSLLMNGSEWDAQNFSYTPFILTLAPRYTRPLSRESSITLPSCGKRILLTNIGTHTHCLHERLVEAMELNNISESDLSYTDFIFATVKYYRAKHLKLLADIRDFYSMVVVISDPPLQHFRLYEDGRKYEKTFQLIDQVSQSFFADVGCNFLNLRDLIGRGGRAYDFLSNKTLSPTSDEIDWIHGNLDYYKFAWQKTKDLILTLQRGSCYGEIESPFANT